MTAKGNALFVVFLKINVKMLGYIDSHDLHELKEIRKLSGKKVSIGIWSLSLEITLHHLKASSVINLLSCARERKKNDNVFFSNTVIPTGCPFLTGQSCDYRKCLSGLQHRMIAKP